MLVSDHPVRFHQRWLRSFFLRSRPPLLYKEGTRLFHICANSFTDPGYNPATSAVRPMTIQFATSYFGNRILRHVITDMNALRQNGFDIVLHTFSELDLRFYPRTMVEIVDASK